MSLKTYVIRAIQCDSNCDEEFEGLPGMTASEVREASWRDHWTYIGRADYCPRHASELRAQVANEGGDAS